MGSGRVPELIIFERERVGAAWDGDGAFSSGFLTLCTPGEKDVGFPYGEQGPGDPFGPLLSSDLFARFSWPAFLVANDLYADWVDRDRAHPNHALFAKYLGWVFEQAGQTLVQAEVKRVSRVNDKWCVESVKDGWRNPMIVDGVVLTGCGDARRLAGQEKIAPDRVFDAASFWPNRARFLDAGPQKIVVAGNGGSAGTIVAWLAERYLENDKQIHSISPMGTLFPRGDGHAERRWFSDPSDWQSLTLADRKLLLERTEAGVISMRIKRVIDGSAKIRYEMGKARSVAIDADDMLSIDVETPSGSSTAIEADLLVNALGFDRWSLLKLVDHPAAAAATAPGGKGSPAQDLRDSIEANIDRYLSMPADFDFPPGLHVPALADLAQGPAMSNLGALGLMATKLLARYVQ